MKKIIDEFWVLIPARGGSKSIPLKNIADLGGKPLINYTINAAKKVKTISRIICSTDSSNIEQHCLDQDIEVSHRSDYLSGDDVPTIDVIVEFLQHSTYIEKAIPKYLVLLEPTSPFVQKSHIEECIDKIGKAPEATSIQTVTDVPPNHHAYNQRFLDGDCSNFVFPDKRKNSFNKQSKPKYYVHGNLRIMKSESLLKSRDLFGSKSLAVIIERKFALDADSYDDFELAEMYIKAGLVSC